MTSLASSSCHRPQTTRQVKEIDMELLTIIATVAALFALIDLAAVHKGADSRDRIGDDWARRTLA